MINSSIWFLVCFNSLNLFSFSLLNCCSCWFTWAILASNEDLADCIEAVLFEVTAWFAFLISASNDFLAFAISLSLSLNWGNNWFAWEIDAFNCSLAFKLSMLSFSLVASFNNLIRLFVAFCISIKVDSRLIGVYLFNSFSIFCLIRSYSCFDNSFLIYSCNLSFISLNLANSNSFWFIWFFIFDINKVIASFNLKVSSSITLVSDLLLIFSDPCKTSCSWKTFISLTILYPSNSFNCFCNFLKFCNKFSFCNWLAILWRRAFIAISAVVAIAKPPHKIANGMAIFFFFSFIRSPILKMEI